MKWIVAGVLALVVSGLPIAASADRADQLFKKGKKLLAEQRYAEACTAFEQSDHLDPGIGAKLNVARCYQEWGKLASAWRWYSEAEQLARDTKDDRARKIHALIEELDPTVPRLTLSLPAGAVTDHVVVRLDGIELPLTALGSERRVDPGPHQIDVTADGATQSRTVPVESGSSAELTLEVPARPLRPAAAASGVVGGNAGDPDPGRPRRLTGLGLSGAGVVAIGIAGVVALRARSDYHHALSGHCSDDADMCDDLGLTATHGARRRANIATGVTIVGLAAVAGGLLLYFTAPSADHRERAEQAFYVSPALGGDLTGVVLGGGF